MLRLSEIAFRLVPVLVVLWAAVALVGGAAYLAKHADPLDESTAAKAGLGLCAISVALFAGKAVRRVAALRVVAGLLSRLATLRPQGRPVHRTLSRPPATGPPVFLLLLVFRT